jgi:hypothetical protein
MLRAVVVLLAVAGKPALADTFIVDNFQDPADARVTSRVITPDNSGTIIAEAPAPGAFPNSRFDLFGVTNRSVNFDLGDDSVVGVGNPNEFAGDAFGVAPFATYPVTNSFFAVEDLTNGDNPGNSGTAVWTIDVSGLTNISISAKFSAMGDFEATDNAHTFTASIDGGTAQDVFLVNVADDAANVMFNYTMEDGVTVVTLIDPLTLTDGTGAQTITNNFTTTGTRSILGTGSVLTLTYTPGPNDGGTEVFAFDDLTLTADVGGGGDDADFDGDGDVDGQDFLAWQRGLGAVGNGTPATGDANDDTDVDADDLAVWKTQFDAPAAATGAIGVVPEPASLALAAFGMVAAMAAGRRRG